MMAANAANDGSGRCQPKFASDDEYRKMVIRNQPMPRARPLVATKGTQEGATSDQR
jgi:hypothetical protein